VVLRIEAGAFAILVVAMSVISPWVAIVFSVAVIASFLFSGAPNDRVSVYERLPVFRGWPLAILAGLVVEDARFLIVGAVYFLAFGSWSRRGDLSSRSSHREATVSLGSSG
jgi:hypothetical protein